MKLNIKTIGKGLAALGTIVGGVILTAQTRNSLKDEEYEPTFEPLGEPEETEEVEEDKTEPEVEVEVEES